MNEQFQFDDDELGNDYNEIPFPILISGDEYMLFAVFSIPAQLHWFHFEHYKISYPSQYLI